MKHFSLILLIATAAVAAGRLKVSSGILEGGVGPGPTIRVFRGVPFAAPPVGRLRWASPQPVERWQGVRKADKFGAHCMQTTVFDDIIFRGEMSEDCLYLTVWTPAKSARERLPVYVWFYGGGFSAGGGDEPRYDGESFAKRGIVVVNVNYRLGVFGFMAHPELTQESKNKASGDYGLLDQVAGLQWVKENIAAFGGDSQRITVGGESAGSLSVSALMASPQSRNLFQQAIGESGAFFGSVGGQGLASLAESEKRGAAFGASVGAKSLAELRAMPADQLLRESSKPGGGFSILAHGRRLLSTARPHRHLRGGPTKPDPVAGWMECGRGSDDSHAGEAETHCGELQAPIDANVQSSGGRCERGLSSVE